MSDKEKAADSKETTTPIPEHERNDMRIRSGIRAGFGSY